MQTDHEVPFIKNWLISIVVWEFLCMLAMASAVPTNAQQSASSASVTAEEAYEIGVEAYVYFYPLVSIDLTRRVATNVEAGKIPAFGQRMHSVTFGLFPPLTSKQ